MIQIFSKEFKDALRDAIAQSTNVVKNVVAPQAKAKIVKMYDTAVDVSEEVAGEVKEQVSKLVGDTKPSKQELEKRTSAKKALREEAKSRAKAANDAIKAAIETFRGLSDVEEIYCQRSELKPTFRENENWMGLDNSVKTPIVTETAKVTVIGVVKRLSNGKFRLYVSLSRRNPSDQFVKNQGFLLALQRAYDPHAKFEIDGKPFETIKIGDFDNPLLKDLFLSVADELINKYEYTQETYTKPIEKNVRDMLKNLAAGNN